MGRASKKKRNQQRNNAAEQLPTQPVSGTSEANAAQLDALAQAQGHAEPEATVRDPASGVHISPFEPDMGPKAALNKRPLAPVVTQENGMTVTRVMVTDILDMWLGRETITLRQYGAGKEFKAAYEVAQKGIYPSVNMLSAGSGGGSDSDPMINRLFYTERLRSMYDKLGGHNTVLCRTIRLIVGEGRSFDDMVRDYSHGVNEWRGLLRGALDVLAVAIYDVPLKTHNAI